MRLEEILITHPRQVPFAISEITSGIRAIFECADANIACADACLGEDQVQDLVRCIRINEDCAEICEVTGKVLSRQTETDPGVIRAQLQACIAANRACAEECDRHAQQHQHCRVCAAACRVSEEACRKLLEKFPAPDISRIMV